MVYRVYRELELNLRIKPRRRLKRDYPGELDVPVAQNQVWSMDFMSDRLADGRGFRTFNVIDDYNREALGIEVDFHCLRPESCGHWSKSLNGAGSLQRFVATMALSI